MNPATDHNRNDLALILHLGCGGNVFATPISGEAVDVAETEVAATAADRILKILPQSSRY